MTETCNTITTGSTVAHNLGGLALVLAAGATGGLPMPFNVAVSEYVITLNLANYDELAQWAIWIDEPIQQTGPVAWAQADLLGFQVHVAAVLVSEVTC